VIRGKLIAPTNILLEHPVLSPVEDAEFFLLTTKEYKRRRIEWIRYGVLLGLIAAVLATAVLSFALAGFR